MKLKMILALLFAIGYFSCGDDDPGENPTDTLPRIAISSVTLFEGNNETVFNFSVRLSVASMQQVSVNYTTEEISAGKNTDFIPKSGTLTIPAGETTVELSIEIITDIIKENDEEFEVILSNPINATISNGRGIGTIRNDDTLIDIPEDGYITPESYPGMTLAWADEFDGPNIDMSSWTHELGDHGWGNNEWQNYTASSQNSYIADGKLFIEARENNGDYTSARMVTQHKQEFAFGRVDIRAKLPFGQGIWPALWMLGDKFATIGWPACGEIDIMELIGHEPSTVHGTAHWGPEGSSFSINSGSSFTLSGTETFNDKFHVFSIIWSVDQIKWYVDDEEIHSITPANTGALPYPFNDEFFFIFNVAVGGNWPGYPDATTQFPQQMIVDYIRVFQ